MEPRVRESRSCGGTGVMKLARSSQGCALGAAICGAVAAGSTAGGHPDFAAAQAAMTGTRSKVALPDGPSHAVYGELYGLYREMHDAFGTESPGSLHGVMKKLIALRERAGGRG